jgi:hypothetical protein
MRLAARIPAGLKLHGSTTKYVLKVAMESFLPQGYHLPAENRLWSAAAALDS